MKGIISQIKKIRITRKIEEYFRNIKLGYTQLGLTTIALSPNSKTRSIFSIEHLGSLGSTVEKNINPNLKRQGFPTIEELKEIYEVIEERGSPESYYSIEFDFHIYQPKNN